MAMINKINDKINDSICWQECEKGNTDSLLVGVTTCTDIMEISVVVPWEAVNRAPARCYYTIVHIYIHSTSSYRDTCSSLFTAALFIIARNLK